MHFYYNLSNAGGKGLCVTHGFAERFWARINSRQIVRHRHYERSKYANLDAMEKEILDLRVDSNGEIPIGQKI